MQRTDGVLAAALLLRFAEKGTNTRNIKFPIQERPLDELVTTTDDLENHRTARFHVRVRRLNSHLPACTLGVLDLRTLV